MIQFGSETATKYDYLIGMIEGCMEKDSDIVATEKLLDSLIQELKKESYIDFMNWLIDEKYCLKNPVDDCVNAFIELSK